MSRQAKVSCRAPARKAGAAAPVKTRILLILCALVAGSGLVAYANSLAGVFVLDDMAHIVDNFRIRALSPIGDLLATRRPLVTLSLAVNYALGELNPWGYHLFNVCIHLLAAMTLFGVVRRTLLTARLRDRYGAASAWIAAAVALIWTVHPLQTQSVTYVIQRGESLMGLFYLLTLYCLIRGATAMDSVDDGMSRGRHGRTTAASKHDRAWYVAAIIACALGMGSKAVMVTAPIVVLLFDRVFLAASWRSVLHRRWGLYVGLAATWMVLVACGVVRGVFQSAGAATVGLGVHGVSPVDYALTQPSVIRHYLKLCFLPSPLCLDYGWPIVRSIPQAAGSLVGLIALLAMTLWALRRKPALGFVAFWFFAILAPTSSFIPIRDAAFEHRMYLPLAAVTLLVVIGAYHGLLHLRERGVLPIAGVQVIAATAVLCVAGALTYQTIRRNRDYHSQKHMWENVLAQRPDNARAWNNYAGSLSEEGDLDGAIDAARKSLELDPQNAAAYNNLAMVYRKQGRYEDAIALHEKALELNPHLGLAHAHLVQPLYQAGRLEEAVAHGLAALQIRPDPATHLNLVEPLLLLGRIDEAVEHGREAVRLRPHDAKSLNNLAQALRRAGDDDEALRLYREALSIDPDLWQAYYNMGTLLAQRTQHEEAVAAFRDAVRIKPRYADAHFQLGRSLAALGKQKDAILAYEATLAANPSHKKAQDQLQLARGD